MVVISVVVMVVMVVFSLSSSVTNTLDTGAGCDGGATASFLELPLNLPLRYLRILPGRNLDFFSFPCAEDMIYLRISGTFAGVVPAQN